MSIVDVLEVKYVSENPSAFDAPLRFEVTFECLDSLEDDLEWKIVYKFRGDRLGVTVVSITCAYLDQPFVSVGYYVNNEYFAPGAGPREGGAAVPPEDAPPDFGAERVFRNLCADQPRVTRYAINARARRASAMRSRGGAPSSLQHDHMLQENDDQLAALGGKVSALRALSYDIEGEDGSVGGAGDLLRRTMGKLDAMIGAGGNRHMWYLVAFVMAVMFCLCAPSLHEFLLVLSLHDPTPTAPGSEQ
ncbi:hypothetical protein JL722_5384 [Aureococcus anophagefferens]|nr:hypothetical protein JL722_5384 [Aureococcus anophagefferens]